MQLSHGDTYLKRVFCFFFTYFFLLLKLSETDGFDDPLDRTPRRRDPPTWLKENPDYEVEGDMLEVHLHSVLLAFSLTSKITLPASAFHTQAIFGCLLFCSFL